eukprot:278614-Chlamydomonas_euryale.AAC.1
MGPLAQLTPDMQHVFENLTDGQRALLVTAAVTNTANFGAGRQTPGQIPGAWPLQLPQPQPQQLQQQQQQQQ